MEHMGTCYGLMSINVIVASLGMWHLQPTPSSLVLLDFPANTDKNPIVNHVCGQIQAFARLFLRAFCMQLKLMQQFNSQKQQTEAAGKLFPRLVG